MPEWKSLSARTGLARNRKPVFALVKKELQLQQVSLLGAAGLLVIHTGTIVLRVVHHFEGEILPARLLALHSHVFWMLWLVMAPVIGSMAVAEERRLGVMDGQLCLPVSRRTSIRHQGDCNIVSRHLYRRCHAGVVGKNWCRVSGGQSVFAQSDSPIWGRPSSPSRLAHAGEFLCLDARAEVFLRPWALASPRFFVTSTTADYRRAGDFPRLWTNIFFKVFPMRSNLPIIIAVPTIIVTLLWLAYLNFINFPAGLEVVAAQPVRLFLRRLSLSSDERHALQSRLGSF